MGAPTLADARRAADEILSAGVGTVLLFGSLARGETRDDSDIDLIAIYDDLDYSERQDRRCDLESQARRAAGYRVDVLVTDAPEWARRTTAVPCSIEARIARDAIRLADAAHHGSIDWDKEIGTPDNPAAEMQTRFSALARAVGSLKQQLAPEQREHDAAAAANFADLAAREDDRFAKACQAAHLVLETAAKVTYVTTLGTAPPRRHQILLLLADQPGTVRTTIIDHCRDIDFTTFDEWSQAGRYNENPPVEHYDDVYLRRHVSAANRVAEFVGDHCSELGFDADMLRRFLEDLHDSTAALNGPLRAVPHQSARGQSQPGRGLGL